jgi:transcriptional antiterminator Rof (Rho-off)
MVNVFKKKGSWLDQFRFSHDFVFLVAVFLIVLIASMAGASSFNYTAPVTPDVGASIKGQSPNVTCDLFWCSYTIEIENKRNVQTDFDVKTFFDGEIDESSVQYFDYVNEQREIVTQTDKCLKTELVQVDSDLNDGKKVSKEVCLSYDKVVSFETAKAYTNNPLRLKMQNEQTYAKSMQLQKEIGQQPLSLEEKGNMRLLIIDQSDIIKAVTDAMMNRKYETTLAVCI